MMPRRRSSARDQIAQSMMAQSIPPLGTVPGMQNTPQMIGGGGLTPLNVPLGNYVPNMGTDPIGKRRTFEQNLASAKGLFSPPPAPQQPQDPLTEMQTDPLLSGIY